MTRATCNMQHATCNMQACKWRRERERELARLSCLHLARCMSHVARVRDAQRHALFFACRMFACSHVRMFSCCTSHGARRMVHVRDVERHVREGGRGGERASERARTARGGGRERASERARGREREGEGGRSGEAHGLVSLPALSLSLSISLRWR